MRLLHTADWHLGRPFHGASLLDHQAAFLAGWPSSPPRSGSTPCSSPATSTTGRCRRPRRWRWPATAFAQLAADGRQVVVIPGNHDSAQRLAFGAPLLARAGLHLLHRPVALRRARASRPAAIYGIPYLEPELAGPRLGCTERGHSAVLARGDGSGAGGPCDAPGTGARASCSPTRSSPAPPPRPASGSSRSAARRRSRPARSPAPTTSRSATCTDRRPPSPDGTPGSPLAFSFSEAADVKSVTIVELDGPGTVRTRTVPCPVPRGLTRIRGHAR